MVEGEIKTLRVSEATHNEFMKVVGMLQMQRGGNPTVDDAVQFLLDFYHEKVKEAQQK